MSPKILINRLEISFWNRVIPLMEQSIPIRFIMAQSYMIVTKAPSSKLIFLGLLIIVAGGLLGFILGVLQQLL
jgi:hypothetical protein